MIHAPFVTLASSNPDCISKGMYVAFVSRLRASWIAALSVFPYNYLHRERSTASVPDPSSRRSSTKVATAPFPFRAGFEHIALTGLTQATREEGQQRLLYRP